jgi:predicted ATPase
LPLLDLGDEYIFKLALLQDGAYSMLLRGKRQELHARVATVLEQKFPDLVERQPESLAPSSYRCRRD